MHFGKAGLRPGGEDGGANLIDEGTVKLDHASSRQEDEHLGLARVRKLILGDEPEDVRQLLFGFGNHCVVLGDRMMGWRSVVRYAIDEIVLLRECVPSNLADRVRHGCGEHESLTFRRGLEMLSDRCDVGDETHLEQRVRFV